MRVEQIGDATLYCGDCLEVLPTLGAVDAVVTDPPYGIAYASNHVAPTTTASWMGGAIAGDADLSIRDAIVEHAGAKAWAVFQSWRAPLPSNVRGVLVWDKGPASGMGDLMFPWKMSHELIAVGGEGWAGPRDEGVIQGCWVVTRASMGRQHPNEKPVTLLERLVRKAPGESVLDPCMGSGTTGVACANLGRKFIGIEIDPGYFDIACERIEMAQAQGRLFA